MYCVTVLCGKTYKVITPWPRKVFFYCPLAGTAFCSMLLRRLSSRRRAPSFRVSCSLRGWHDVCTPGRLGQVKPDAKLSVTPRVWLRTLHQRPLLCATGSATVAAAAGDLSAQACARVQGGLMAGREEPPIFPDLSRTVMYSALGALLVGMAGEVWFRSLLLKFPGMQYEAAARTVLDLSLHGPVTLGLIVSSMTLWRTADCEYTAYRLSIDWFHSLGKLWVFWLSGSALNYIFVPMHKQSLFALGLSVLWNSYISHRIHLPCALHKRSEDWQLHVGEYFRDSYH